MHRLLLALSFMALLGVTSAGQDHAARPKPVEVELPLADLVRSNTAYSKFSYVSPAELDSEQVFASLGSDGAHLTPAAIDSLFRQALHSKGYRVSRSTTFAWIDKKSAFDQEVVPVDAAGLASAHADDLVWFHMQTRFQSVATPFKQFRSRVGLVFPLRGAVLMGRAADVREVANFGTMLNARSRQVAMFELPAQVSVSTIDKALLDLGIGTFAIVHGKLIVSAENEQFDDVRQVLEAFGE